MLSEEEMDKIDDEFGNIPLLYLARLYRFIQENYVSEKEILYKIRNLLETYEGEHFIPKAEIQKLLEETNE